MFICGFLLVSTMIEDSMYRRIIRFLRMAWMAQLLLVSTCRGFLYNLATTTTTTTTSTNTNIWIHPYLLGSRQCRLHLTQLHEQRPIKPPRFVQKAHSSNNNSAKKNSNNNFVNNNNNDDNDNNYNNNDIIINNYDNNNNIQNNRPRPKQSYGKKDTKESIDDLEARLMKRWGTLPKERNMARPVADPWDMSASLSSSSTTSSTTTTRSMNDKSRITEAVFGEQEFYDEDDEGFEIVELNDEEYEQELKSSRVKLSHLIAPEPVGGRGTNLPPPIVDRAEAKKETYFFNPNKQPVVEKSTKPMTTAGTTQKNMANTETTTTTETNSKPRKLSTRASSSQPIVDEDDNPILLTIEEALAQFQSSSTDEEAVAAADTESPIVAYQQQSEKPSWAKIGITSQVLLENLEAMYCTAPLSVQAKSIPHVLTGADVLVGTYTGSGKTLAFLTPLIQRLLWSDEDPGLAVVIVAPGRELASQIASVARSLVEDTPLRVQLAIGGTTFTRSWDQIRKRKPNIIVGTPGRIAELIVGKPGEKIGKLKISNLQTLVLDEFDALLEYKPHREPTRAILQTLQRRHGDALQSILCSATASDLMDSPQVTEYLRPGFATAMADDDDAFVTTSNAKRPQVSRTVMHGVVHVPHRRFALDTVRRILHTEPIPQQILIFAESAHKVDIVVEKLAERGIIAAALHGGRGSEKMDRAEVSKALREGYVGIVVATELAARGLDAPLLTHVINLDLPTDASHYAHRAGRCGRGGRPGVVINMTTSPKERNVPLRFAETLGIDMHAVEPRDGKLMLVDPETQILDQ